MEYVQPVLTVHRFGDCLHFYRDLLQMKLVGGAESGPVATLQSGDRQITLLDAKKVPAEVTDLLGGKPGGLRVTLVFRAVDIDAEYDRLHKAGVRYHTKPHDFQEWGVRSSVCLDPDGNAVEIVQA
jgi:catechol 2,3-dioxygenase-like lactoylglutathione lyase family enzyme